MNSLFFEASDKYGNRKDMYRQKNGYSCGYYCARLIINVLGDGNDKNLVPLLKLTPDGVNQKNLIRTLRARGVTASRYYDLSVSRMKKFLEAGKYIIVYDHMMEHWLVLGRIHVNPWQNYTMMRFYDPQQMWNYKPASEVQDRLKGYGLVCGKKVG
jgi:hypothetical protein